MFFVGLNMLDLFACLNGCFSGLRKLGILSLGIFSTSGTGVDGIAPFQVNPKHRKRILLPQARSILQTGTAGKQTWCLAQNQSATWMSADCSSVYPCTNLVCPQFPLQKPRYNPDPLQAISSLYLIPYSTAILKFHRPRCSNYSLFRSKNFGQIWIVSID